MKKRFSRTEIVSGNFTLLLIKKGLFAIFTFRSLRTEIEYFLSVVVSALLLLHNVHKGP